MKVHFRSCPSDLLPELCRRYERRREKVTGDYDYDPEEGDELDRLIYPILEYWDRIVRPINRRWCAWRVKHYVKVDYDDVWNCHNTLSAVIAPTLKMLKERKHGAGFVDDEDVPEHLRRGKDLEPHQTDDNWFKRWEWVLDEMIWAFEQDHPEYDWESQYHHNSSQLEMNTKPTKENPKLHTISFNDQKDPTKPKYWHDREGSRAHQERMTNAFRLFGKYYQNLWD